MTNDNYDLIIIGGGPAGYVAAIRASQLGKTVCCIEKSKTLGGTCLNVGCIPSKALLNSSEHFFDAQKSFKEHGIEIENISIDVKQMMSRKDKIVTNLTNGIDFLFKKNKITKLNGTAKIVEKNKVLIKETNQIITASNIIIASGSKSATINNIKIDNNLIGDSTTALSYLKVPERLVIIGAGVIGLEIGSIWLRLGSKVTVLEYSNHILPTMDIEISKIQQRMLKRQGFKFKLKTKVESIEKHEDVCRVISSDGKVFEADKVLLAVGRTPKTQDLNLDTIGVSKDHQGFIKVDKNYKTTVDNIYAVGDVIGGLMLAHKASEEGIACVEKLYSNYGHVNYNVIPSVVYTEPEVACIGKNEEQLKTDGIDYKKGSFNFKGNGRAVTMGAANGIVKVLSDAKTDKILGVHIVGPRAGDIISEAAAAMKFGASSKDIAQICHAHPSLSEALQEAALDVSNAAIHG